MLHAPNTNTSPDLCLNCQNYCSDLQRQNTCVDRHLPLLPHPFNQGLRTKYLYCPMMSRSLRAFSRRRWEDKCTAFIPEGSECRITLENPWDGSGKSYELLESIAEWSTLIKGPQTGTTWTYQTYLGSKTVLISQRMHKESHLTI